MILQVLFDSYSGELSAALYSESGQVVSRYDGSRYGLIKILKARGVKDAAGFDRHVSTAVKMDTVCGAVGIIDDDTGEWW